MLFELQHDEVSYRNLENRFGVPRSTICRWNKNIEINPELTPEALNWGLHRRIFDDATERNMSEYIRTNFVQHNRLFTNEDFRVLAFAMYRQVYLEAEDAPRFTCSDAFIHGFLVRNHFSLRREHFKRPPAINESDVQAWTERLRVLLSTENNDLILNCDETAGRVYPNNILTWRS
jgi:hypothetical protein